MNGADREMMAQIKAFADGLAATYQPKSTTLDAYSGLPVFADSMPFSPSVGVMSTTALTAFARTILDDPNAATACLTLGAPRIVGISLSVPGYLRLQVGPTAIFQLAWGTFVCPPNGSDNVVYGLAFPNASFPVVSGSDGNPSGTQNTPGVIGGSAIESGFSVFNAADGIVSGYYIAVGY